MWECGEEKYSSITLSWCRLYLLSATYHIPALLPTSAQQASKTWAHRYEEALGWSRDWINKEQREETGGKSTPKLQQPLKWQLWNSFIRDRLLQGSKFITDRRGCTKYQWENYIFYAVRTWSEGQRVKTCPFLYTPFLWHIFNYKSEWAKEEIQHV